ncbi:hypothetical protein OPV22_022471 [Ensete ventricosum]|uniref:Uncharacterized protein n=1 Tax=Ensete ventricosum TaxID=4639 RepID=A0AAV8QFP6_ENSVE|nr:hypothetical protein OPV22_022471 [Ensete ventricosum]
MVIYKFGYGDSRESKILTCVLKVRHQVNDFSELRRRTRARNLKQELQDYELLLVAFRSDSGEASELLRLQFWAILRSLACW